MDLLKLFQLESILFDVRVDDEEVRELLIKLGELLFGGFVLKHVASDKSRDVTEYLHAHCLGKELQCIVGAETELIHEVGLIGSE